MTLAMAGQVFDFEVCLDLLVFTLTPFIPSSAKCKRQKVVGQGDSYSFCPHKTQ
jgi:hypothetical protein